jgi:hypothetical protein
MDSDVPVPSGRALPLTKAEKLLQKEQRRNGKIEEKSKLAAIMMSNCGGKNKRWEYVQLLRKHMPVDVYGACGNLRWVRRFAKWSFNEACILKYFDLNYFYSLVTFRNDYNKGGIMQTNKQTNKHTYIIHTCTYIYIHG